ncbi:MAG TPA: EAL domain-containing protein, partial [Acidimicrobiales bacterium]|nr:EAL domain-containing protein [Acidimicrobiales bacterium]
GAATGNVLDGCRRLRAQGYRLAVEDFGSDGGDELLNLAQRVSLDVAALPPERLADAMARCRGAGVEIVATGVDSPEALARCAPLDVDLFQGYLLSRSHGEPGHQLAPGRLAGLRMSARLLDAECPASEVEEIVRSDPAMTHQLLQLAGIGAAGGMRRTVTSVRQALVFVGWRRLQSWVALLLLSDDGEAREEEIATALMRARMCELLAARAGCEADAGYTGGMLSSLDVVLGVPLDQVLATLPLDPALHAAIARGEGPLGRLIADVVDVQLGRPETAVRSGIGDATMRWAAVDALTWTVGMTSVLETAHAA